MTSFDVIQHLTKINDFILQQLKDELMQQGHRDTGRLINSLQYQLIQESNAVVALFTYLQYGQYVNDGVPASKVKYPIRVLIDWARRKGFTDPRSAAFAIRAKHKKEGIPTRGSFRFSRNGRRTQWRDHVLSNIRGDLDAIIDTELIDPLRIFFFTMLKENQVI